MPVSNETRLKWNNKLNAIITAIDNSSIILTDNELSFIDNMEKDLAMRIDITMNQSKYLNSIYGRIK